MSGPEYEYAYEVVEPDSDPNDGERLMRVLNKWLKHADWDLAQIVPLEPRYLCIFKRRRIVP